MTAIPSCAAFPRPPISSIEANLYYYGLYSRPILVARTSTTLWKPPVCPPGYPSAKWLRTVGNHPLGNIWEGNLAPQIHKILESRAVKWTSTDVARIGLVGELLPPVIIWIGVQPATLSREDGHAVAMACKALLVENQISNVEVEIRESVVTQYAGPKLLKPAPPADPTAELREPLTSTLGLSICSTRTLWAEGTGGFYLTDRNMKLYLVTARHVVIPSDSDNQVHEHKFSSQRLNKIALFSPTSFKDYHQRIAIASSDKQSVAEYMKRVRQVAFEGVGPAETNSVEAMKVQTYQDNTLKEAMDASEALRKLHVEVAQNWSNLENRIIGHLRFSPVLKYGAGEKRYTQDFALIEIDQSKIDIGSFTGNAIDLGTEIVPGKFTRMMFPHPKNSHSFTYPANRLFQIRGTIPDAELHAPTMEDQNDERCLIVLKRGRTTGLTIGRANSISSFVRQGSYLDGMANL
ncbi:unnamed protein product [Tuber aestivum]|uniref:Uncharacterized protein n=1 Tax=Tuber aestivum TaxID=59557 RepID=A0A292Q532_9PEZI|nr:unnamed protein product [Tuber aestivum]